MMERDDMVMIEDVMIERDDTVVMEVVMERDDTVMMKEKKSRLQINVTFIYFQIGQ